MDGCERGRSDGGTNVSSRNGNFGEDDESEQRRFCCLPVVCFSDVGYIKGKRWKRSKKEAAIKRRRASARDEWANCTPSRYDAKHRFLSGRSPLGFNGGLARYNFCDENGLESEVLRRGGALGRVRSKFWWVKGCPECRICRPAIFSVSVWRYLQRTRAI